jgi:uncharacterized membrane protein SpoIIM required for sporulation
MGLGRNHVVYLTQDGLLGVKVRSIVTLLLALLLPLPLLAAVYYVFHAGALAVYITAWIASSGLLYDELRWRGIRSLDGNSSGKPLESQASWLIPWHSIRMADWNGRTLWFTSTNPARKASFTFDRGSSPLVERSLDSSGVRYSYKRPRLPRVLTGFWALALILFVLSQSILIFAATLPFFPGEEQMYTTVLNSTRSQVAGASFAEAFRAIYLNNIQVAWGGMLPVLGQLSFGLASYNTGRVLQVIAIGDHIPSSIILVSLYLLPHTWIEESAYPIATVAGLLAVTRWRSVAPGAFTRRQNWGSTKLAQAMGGVALILLAAGLIETLGLYMGFGEVLLWIPVGAGYYLYSRWNRERIRSASQLGSA